MSYARDWNNEHARRLMTADFPDKRLVDFLLNDCRAGSRWLDIGCGAGINSRFMAGIGAIVTGIDGSPAAIKRASSARTRFDPKIAYMVRDLTLAWPFPNHSFDGAIDIRCLENLTLSEIDHAWHELCRVLKPGGRFFALMAGPNRDDALTTVGKVTKLRHSMLAGMSMKFPLDDLVATIQATGENGKSIEDWVITARRMK